MAFAVSKAFDITLLHLARSLRDSYSSSRSESSSYHMTIDRRYSDDVNGSDTTMAQALGTGLFLDAHDAVAMAILGFVSLLRHCSPPSEGNSENSEREGVVGQYHGRPLCSDDDEWTGIRERGEAWCQGQLETLGKWIRS